MSYGIGLWFTLRTHAAVIWNNDVDEKKVQESHHTIASQQPTTTTPHARLQRHGSTQNSSSEAAARGAEIRESQLYKRILGQSLKQVGLGPREEVSQQATESTGQNGLAQTPHIPPPKSSGGESARSDLRIPGLSEAENTNLVREVAEMAATAATIAARDATRAPRRLSTAPHGSQKTQTVKSHAPPAEHDETVLVDVHVHEAPGGHDAPNWSRMKSSIILCGATVLYALIAEILVNTVDVVLKNVAIDEKFLGITLFALVPNTTEFLVSSSCDSTMNKRLTFDRTLSPLP